MIPKSVATPKNPIKQHEKHKRKHFTPTTPHEKKPTDQLSPSRKYANSPQTTAISQCNTQDQRLQKLLWHAKKAGVSEEMIFCTSNKRFKVPQKLWNTYSITWNKLLRQRTLNKKDLINLSKALTSKKKKSFCRDSTWKKIYHTSIVLAHRGGWGEHFIHQLTPQYLSLFFTRGDTAGNQK
ncbi:hypothetical protein [Kistimonas scapharcae]|uniref:hypothetical protein n=1 Tax=Kistimonas scapharcae TaxID=1036133 RepID=UPI0031ED31D4